MISVIAIRRSLWRRRRSNRTVIDSVYIETVEKCQKSIFPERIRQPAEESKDFLAKFQCGLRQAQAIKIIFLQSHIWIIFSISKDEPGCQGHSAKCRIIF